MDIVRSTCTISATDQSISIDVMSTPGIRHCIDFIDLQQNLCVILLLRATEQKGNGTRNGVGNFN